MGRRRYRALSSTEDEDGTIKHPLRTRRKRSDLRTRLTSTDGAEEHEAGRARLASTEGAEDTEV